MDIATKDIINGIENTIDYPVYVNRSEIKKYFDNLKLLRWKPISTDRLCSFCSDNGNYHNAKSDIVACGTCMIELSDQEFDIFYPEDHKLSMQIRDYVCQWVNKECMIVISVDLFFGEYGMKYNLGYHCLQPILNIENTDVAMPHDGNVIAHYDCVKDRGFENYYSHEVYNSIFEIMDIKTLIDALGSNYDDTLERSTPEQNIMSFYIPTVNMDLTEMKNFIRCLDIERRVPIQKQTECIFCNEHCTHYNEMLNMHVEIIRKH